MLCIQSVSLQSENQSHQQKQKQIDPLLVSHHAHQSSINPSILLSSFPEDERIKASQVNSKNQSSPSPFLPNNPPSTPRPTACNAPLPIDPAPARTLALARLSGKIDFEIRVDEAGAAFQSPADSAAIGGDGGQDGVDGQVREGGCAGFFALGIAGAGAVIVGSAAAVDC
jgi:hypothetical protein